MSYYIVKVACFFIFIYLLFFLESAVTRGRVALGGLPPAVPFQLFPYRVTCGPWEAYRQLYLTHYTVRLTGITDELGQGPSFRGKIHLWTPWFSSGCTFLNPDRVILPWLPGVALAILGLPG
jgi:hypothetical protein